MKKTTKATAARNVIGGRIRQARLKCAPAVSQEDLAGRLAARNITIDRSAISRIESGARYLMDYEIAAIARSLKVSVGWLFGEIDHGR
jgi:transcriptional regulator with XRE-family HTH domain